MISPDEITRKAARKYKAVLRVWLTNDTLFPMDFPAGRPSKNLSKRRQEIEALMKHAVSPGYQLEMQTVNKQRLGTQTYPKRIVIETLDDYLAVVRKQTEFRAFTNDVKRIRSRLPGLEDWLCANPYQVIEHTGTWNELLDVCEYFQKHPRPGVYLRELPIAVHTKFIENHTKVLRSLFDALLPPESIDGTTADFNDRYGLRTKPTRVRLRLLDEQLEWAYDLRLDDIAVPVEQAAHLLAAHIKPSRVIIVENLTNFLTLPPMPNTVGLFGGGFRVHVLRDLYWLRECVVFYWGDIDAHGFDILSQLRGIFPHTQSVMMGQDILDAYAPFVVTGSSADTATFAHLTTEERRVANHVEENKLRLEQEHIAHNDAITRLKDLLRDKS